MCSRLSLSFDTVTSMVKETIHMNIICQVTDRNEPHGPTKPHLTSPVSASRLEARALREPSVITLPVLALPSSSPFSSLSLARSLELRVCGCGFRLDKKSLSVCEHATLPIRNRRLQRHFSTVDFLGPHLRMARVRLTLYPPPPRHADR